MDASKIANHVFIIGGLLIVSALFLYIFFPKLRKNSFTVEGWEKLPKYEALQERYKQKIESGEVLFIKGKYGDLFSNKKLIILISSIIFFIFFTTPYLMLKLSNFFQQCGFNEKLSLRLFVRKGDGFILIFFLVFLLQIPQLLRQIYFGKKTGLDNSPHKKYRFDTIIAKYDNGNLKDDIFGLLVSFVIVTYMFFNIPNWDIINKSSSFVEANKMAYEQCMEKEK